MEKKGALIVISGFSGAGKGTVVRELTGRFGYQVSVSATTRDRREGEENGKEYFFLTREEFECMIKDGKLIEWAEYVGNYYGTPRDFVENERNAGRDVILEIEVQGALKVKEQYPEALLIFIAPPSAEELKNRLVNRRTDSMEVIEKRLSKAAEEALAMQNYDYLVINDSLETCVEDILKISEVSKKRVAAQVGLADRLQRELQVFSKGDH